MHQHAVRTVFAVAFVLMIGGISRAQQPERQPDASGPAAEEMRILAPLVGKWTLNGAVKPSAINNEEFSTKGEAEARWIHGGHFLRVEGSAESDRGGMDWTEIMTYDRLNRRYRRFIFTSQGIAGESHGKWDEETRTMTWTSVNLPEGWEGVSTLKFADDEAKTTLLVKNVEGQTMRDASMTMTRKK